MAYWRVKTAEKKNVFIRSTYRLYDKEGVSTDKFFFMEEWYRWGSCLIKSDKAPEAAEDPYTDPLCLDDYETEDLDSDDGCSLMFEFPEGWTDEEKQMIEAAWETGEDFYEITECEDHEVQYYGPLDVDFVSDEEEEEQQPITPSNATWPFSP
jgi:hypothetical protein